MQRDIIFDMNKVVHSHKSHGIYLTLALVKKIVDLVCILVTHVILIYK